jgi:hypothetical protein
MRHPPFNLVRARASLSILCAAYAVAEDAQSPVEIYDSVPLQSSDIRAITSVVLAAHPEVASSPGIKYAEAYRTPRATDAADVIFYPHTDTGGIKTALQVGCSRSGSDQPWACEPAELRRYLRVDNQDFEVRVTGDIGSAEALAVVEATRAGLPLYLESGNADQCQAIILRQASNGHKIQWACPERDTALFMHATAIAGSDTTQTSGWQVSEYIFPELSRALKKQ